MRFLRVFAGVLLVLAACTTPFEPKQPFAPIPPPDSARALWSRTAACVSQTTRLTGARFEEMSWFLVDAYSIWNNEWASGVTTGTHRIYLARPYKDHPGVIAHEEAHAMTGIFDHPDDPFKRCHLTWDTYQQQ